MDVRVNSKKQILRSFAGMLPLALFAVIFYGFLFIGIIVWGLTQVAGIDQESAREIGFPLGILLLLASIYIYLNWLTKSLSSYRLSLQDSDLLVKGIAGWKRIDKKIPINSINKIYIGENANSIEKLSPKHSAINDQVASRLTFFPVSGNSFKLDFATKAFDNESLYKFLVWIKKKGVDINISV